MENKKAYDFKVIDGYDVWVDSKVKNLFRPIWWKNPLGWLLFKEPEWYARHIFVSKKEIRAFQKEKSII